ncbi:MAG: ABC transporter substrate-binding protein [Cyclobacteriaceae bacterium]|nr:ABC transporter substrate-binding protein [Cyclobacteriaceae bacterium]
MTKPSTLDQMGNGFVFLQPPQRIISLVPSQTELLFDLGLNEQVVGITKFCVHPNRWIKSKTIIGGTKNFHFDVIERLNPDLIIGNKEENYEEGIATLQKNFPVWMSDIITIYDATNMIRSVARITNRKFEGIKIVKEIDQAFKRLGTFKSERILYLMWRNPWMGVASRTFIHSMLEKIGFTNVLTDHDRYPELSISDLQCLNPSIVLLSSEPFPFSEKHIPEIQQILPNAKIILVDGEMFSWYGSRMKLAPDYFKSVFGDATNRGLSAIDL